MHYTYYVHPMIILKQSPNPPPPNGFLPVPVKPNPTANHPLPLPSGQRPRNASHTLLSSVRKK